MKTKRKWKPETRSRMAQGVKYSEEVKEQALAMLAVSGNVARTAKALGLPEATVRSWKNHRAREDENDSFAKLREKKKKAFIRSAWNNVERANRLIYKRLNRAEKAEKELDEILDLVKGATKEELSEQEKQRIYRTLATLRIDDLAKLSTVLGTLYDKQALAANEATTVVDGKIAVPRFEDFEV